MEDLRKVVLAFNQRLRSAKKLYGEESKMVKKMVSQAKNVAKLDWTKSGYLSTSKKSLEAPYAYANQLEKASKEAKSKSYADKLLKKSERIKNTLNGKIEKALIKNTVDEATKKLIEDLDEEEKTSILKLRGKARVDALASHFDYLEKLDKAFDIVFGDFYDAGEVFSETDRKSIGSFVSKNKKIVLPLFNRWLLPESDKQNVSSIELGETILGIIDGTINPETYEAYEAEAEWTDDDLAMF